jgi:hypothetical protein
MGYLFFLLLLPWTIFGASNYSIEDLEILSKHESIDEFFTHALDIAPRDRTDNWKRLVLRMADIKASKVLQKSQISDIDFREIEKLFSWKIIQDDDVFKMKRRQIGITYLRSCLLTSSPCLKDFQSFWENDKTDPETSYQIALLGLESGQNSPDPWIILKPSLQSPLSEFYCQKESIQKLVWQKLESESVKPSSKGNLLKRIDNLIHPACLKHMLIKARNHFYNNASAHERELSFHLLKTVGKLDATSVDFFYSLYLMETPSQGELFNLSWATLKEMGQNLERREKVMTLVFKMDLLPDSLLNSLDKLKVKVILRHLQFHFPELLDHYFKRCLEFYQGIGNFPNGNPTLNCKKFLMSKDALGVVDSHKIKLFNSLQNFEIK